MKRKIVIIVTTLATIAVLVALSWNLVSVVDTYNEPGYYLELQNPTKTVWINSDQSHSSRRVVIKQRLLTGETWKEYLD